MGRNVAFAPGIAVFEPCAPNYAVLLVYDELVIGETLSDGANEVDATSSCTYADYSYWARCSQRLFTDGICGPVASAGVASGAGIEIGAELGES